MRRLVVLVLVLAALWAGWWVIGSQALHRGAAAFFAREEAAGRVADYRSLSVRGFPSRFDLTVEGLHLADPVRGIGWRAPFVQLFAMSWKPWHLIAALPPEQQIALPGETVSLASRGLRASLIVTPSAALELDRIAAAGEALMVRSTLGWALRADAAQIATRRVEGDPARHEIGIDLKGLVPEGPFQAAAGRAGLPPRLAEVRMLGVAGFSAPLDRHAAAADIALRSLDLLEARLVWGPLALTGTGRLTLDAEGRPEGTIAVALSNWRQAIQAAVALGLLKPEAVPTWERALGLFAARSGGEQLEMPLVFAKGWVSLGPLPLGPAPRIGQRQ